MDFSREPEHSDKLHVLGVQPWNAEPDIAELVRHPYTPEQLVYSRNHCPIRALDAATFSVKVNGLVKHERAFTLDDLKREFQRKEVVAALQCAGNRRKTMQERDHKEVEGLLWGEGTIANCKWAGVSMRELLERNDDWFGGSIPLEKALDEDGDVLLAYEMNDRPLSPDHGFPFRVVVPGYTGARWVKWVDEITVAERDSENFYQKKDYKVLPTKVQTHEMADKEDWWSKVPALQANPLNSAVASVRVVPPGRLEVKGYAVRGPTGQVSKVEVSVDEDDTWQPATSTYQEGRWSWTLWEATLDVPHARRGKEGKVWCRAVDVAGTMQQPDTDWNLRGVAYDAVGEKTLHVW
ncbi:Oxidoreductase, molybdopterin-binding domain-containing protein [Fomitopsis serialis]|uniref:Oxidoreductase, molybdopterin-binding domain-containing protein n=1 Tax=Fomitopsis serialis TaxID=139415 RepID=UPI002007B128|nr:Oxidoreductase, molybdopterin-binding domain-containing protein [Neoantrodia serialis]KAH9928258.1 Oxidoreductase, molybdopterin-binding domain-containing protein [Neoantrodia serialis]